MKRKSIAIGLILLAGLACSNGRDKSVISASGTIETVEVNVASKVAGQVLSLSYKEGARVAPGDLLAVIDHASLDIQLRQAEAGVRLAEAQLANLVKGASSEEDRKRVV